MAHFRVWNKVWNCLNGLNLWKKQKTKQVHYRKSALKTWWNHGRYKHKPGWQVQQLWAWQGEDDTLALGDICKFCTLAYFRVWIILTKTEFVKQTADKVESRHTRYPKEGFAQFSGSDQCSCNCFSTGNALNQQVAKPKARSRFLCGTRKLLARGDRAKEIGQDLGYLVCATWKKQIPTSVYRW